MQLEGDCTGLWLDEAYCVKAGGGGTMTTSSATASVTPPAPTQAGIPSTCNAYGVAQDDDGRETVASRNRITVTQLYAWNPALNNSRENFWLGEVYCLGVSS
ncbi:hypothetical protein N7499_008503 [Penicillium canescens]|nr:hypothetical protein N7522_012415 [Penicillium canescens]KAJ6076522.1 hypothetical protein N7499_008503 [Penicillium canescens]KAJ6158830.1 hypothetical protein N7485_011656 [Penicillium canescens]